MRLSFRYIVSALITSAAVCFSGTALQGAECGPCEAVYEVAPCDPVCDPCSPGGKGSLFGGFEFGGWVQAGIYTNSHGWRNGIDANGPGHTFTQRNDFSLNQLYFYGEKKLKTKHGFDIGGRADLFYGADAWIAADTGDGKFDAQWISEREGIVPYGYGLSIPQLYASLGYKDLSVKIGKFYTPLGWETITAEDEFFYSHHFGYWIEPAVHTGVIADYEVSDRLKLTAGWTQGLNTSFENKYNDSGVIAGFEFALSDSAKVYYYTTFGKSKNVDTTVLNHSDYQMHSVAFEWNPVKKWSFVTLWDLSNGTDIALDGERTHGAGYGISQRAIYKINDVWGVGTRVEWFKDGADTWEGGEGTEYFGLTLGLNYNPTQRLSIRPEIRYDSALGHLSAPYAGGTRGDQLSGGACGVYKF